MQSDILEQNDNKEGNVLNQWNKINKVMKNIRPTDFVDAYWQERYGELCPYRNGQSKKKDQKNEKRILPIIVNKNPMKKNTNTNTKIKRSILSNNNNARDFLSNRIIESNNCQNSLPKSNLFNSIDKEGDECLHEMYVGMMMAAGFHNVLKSKTKEDIEEEKILLIRENIIKHLSVDIVGNADTEDNNLSLINKHNICINNNKSLSISNIRPSSNPTLILERNNVKDFNKYDVTNNNNNPLKKRIPARPKSGNDKSINTNNNPQQSSTSMNSANRLHRTIYEQRINNNKILDMNTFNSNDDSNKESIYFDNNINKIKNKDNDNNITKLIEKDNENKNTIINNNILIEMKKENNYINTDDVIKRPNPFGGGGGFLNALNVGKDALKKTNFKPKEVILNQDTTNDDKIRVESWLKLENFCKDNDLIINMDIDKDNDSNKISSLVKGISLGRGKFSEVYSGKILKNKIDKKYYNSNSNDNNETIPIAMKIAKFVSTKSIENSEITVVPKLFSDEYHRELTAMKALCPHQNIIQLYGIELESLTLVVELMNIGSLAQVLESEERQIKLDPYYRTRLLKNIVNGLSYMHANNYIHRDIKAFNIMVHETNDGSLIAKIGDFGTSIRILNNEMLLEPCGTSGYTAPEIYDPCQYSFPADVFSLSILAWELFSQHRNNPLVGIDPFQLVGKLKNNLRPIFGPEHPALIKELITKSWVMEPSQRPTMNNLSSVINDLYKSDEKFINIFNSSHAQTVLFENNLLKSQHHIETNKNNNNYYKDGDKELLNNKENKEMDSEFFNKRFNDVNFAGLNIDL